MLAAAALIVLAAPPAALAHANLIRSDPPSGVVLDSAPSEVDLYFDDSVRAQPGTKAIRNRGGVSVLGGSPHVVGSRELVIPLRGTLPRGDYTVLWRALSDDGHSLGGIVTFGVQTGSRRPTAALSAPDERKPLEVVARWFFFAGILGASGSALFRLALGPRGRPPWGFVLAAFIAAAAGGLVLVQQVTLSTRFGLVAAIAAGIAALGAVLCGAARVDPRADVLVWACGLALLPLPSIGGHALDAGRSRLDLPVDIAHLAAASVWFGGLVSLAYLLRSARGDPVTVRRFSALALASVLVLAATGLVRALGELGSFAHLWTTNYGRWLIAKTAILCALVAIGWVNRYRIRGRDGVVARRALRRNVIGEIVLFGGLIAAVALLTQAKPGRDVIPAARAAVIGRQAAEPVGGAVVLAQNGDDIQLGGRVGNGFALGGAVLWQTAPTEGEAGAVARRDLAAHRTALVVRGVAPQYAVAATTNWVVYATATVPPRLVAVRPDGSGRVVLARRLVAPFASRGDRVAWAEARGNRDRVVVRNMRTGKELVAADVPACSGGRCYRIDTVTLADGGVAFDRGAIGSQPSLIVRRAFGASRFDVAEVSRDPQPDLVPASNGVAYFALGRGWYVWRFGERRPRRVGVPAAVQPLRLEHGVWFAIRRTACSDTLVAIGSDGRVRTLVSPADVRARVGVDPTLCVSFAGLSLAGARPLSTWFVSPPDSHSDEGVTSLLLLGRALG